MWRETEYRKRVFEWLYEIDKERTLNARTRADNACHTPVE